MTGIAVKNEGMFDQYEEDDMLMVMSLDAHWELNNRLMSLDDRLVSMKKIMDTLVNREFE